MTAFHFLTHHLRRHPLGSLFIVFLLAAATALSVVVNLQERALRLGSARAADKFDLVIGAAGSEAQLVLSTVFLQPSALTLLSSQQLEDINTNPLVAWSSPVGFGDYFQGQPIIGVNVDFLSYGDTRQPIAGRWFTHHHEAVVGGRSGLNIGDKITPMHGHIGDIDVHEHDGTTYTVVGILPNDGSVWDKAILVPIESVWLVHNHEKNHQHQHDRSKPLREQTHGEHTSPANWYEPINSTYTGGAPAVIVKPKSIAGAYQLRSQYRGNGTQAVFPGEVLVKLYGTLGDVKKLLAVIALITQLLVVLAVTVIISIYLQQQQKNIAALRAFGAPRGKVFLLVWSGLLLLIAVSIVIGAGIGFAIAQLTSKMIGQQNGFLLPVIFTVDDWVLLLGLFLVAAGTALIPSMIHYRQAPADILANQG